MLREVYLHPRRSLSHSTMEYSAFLFLGQKMRTAIFENYQARFPFPIPFPIGSRDGRELTFGRHKGALGSK